MHVLLKTIILCYNQQKSMQGRQQRSFQQFTVSTVNSSFHSHWSLMGKPEIPISYDNLSVKMNLLNHYRQIKPNMKHQVNTFDSKSILPEILCSFFGTNNVTITEKTKCKCPCEKTKDGYCELIMKWIEQQYFWKTDRQFQKIYEYYESKKLEEDIELSMQTKLQQKLNILGLQMANQQYEIMTEILSNYLKHALYYNKFDKLIAESDIYIWIALGIGFHLGFQTLSQDMRMRKILIFWALDISMDNFQDLTYSAMLRHHTQCMQKFQHYYIKWIDVFVSKQVSFKDIVWEWLNQMMFGYMGIQSIAFFVDCFRKKNWKYLYQIMLSYFEHRTNAIKKNTNFLNGTIEKDELYQLILDGKQEWPMIFCTASTFIFKQ